MNLPEKFKERMKKILGTERDYEAFERVFEADEPVRALRVNTLKMSVPVFEEVCNFEHSRIGFCREGFLFECEHIGTHPLHASGAIYIQEPGAMTPVECVNIREEMAVLDVCASPGGKTAQAAAKLGGSGVIVTNEIDAKRASVLAQNAERAGIRNAIVLNTDSASLGKTYKKAFDLVIADVPCSGEGMMRKNPLAVSEWSLSNIEKCAARQREILENVYDCVACGGTLLYSTCTFAPEENEEIIAAFIAEHPDFHLADVPESIKNATSDGIMLGGDENLKKCRRFYPHISGGEGQFAAVLIRDGESSGKDREKIPVTSSKSGEKDSDAAIIREFLCAVLTEEGVAEAKKNRLVKHGDNYFLCPDFPLPASGIKVAGVPVGNVVKGRVVPHHGFFSAYGKFFGRIIDIKSGDERIFRYLHGEEIEADTENGFAAVAYCGAPVGGAKVTSGRAKNYYPKGLRT